MLTNACCCVSAVGVKFINDFSFYIVDASSSDCLEFSFFTAAQGFQYILLWIALLSVIGVIGLLLIAVDCFL